MNTKPTLKMSKASLWMRLQVSFLSMFIASLETVKHLLPFSKYKIHTFDKTATILLENGLKEL